MLMRLAGLLFCLSLQAPLAFAQSSPTLSASLNLQQDGAQALSEGKPLILFFSLPDCPYCKVVRQAYLLPMLREGEPAERPVIRELQLTSAASLVGFDGSRTTQAAVAKQFGVRIAPTVVFVDATGNVLAAPIVGGDGHGFYSAYLDKALAESARKIAAGRLGKAR